MACCSSVQCTVEWNSSVLETVQKRTHTYTLFCKEWPILWLPRILTLPPGTPYIFDTDGMWITECFGVYILNRTLENRWNQREIENVNWGFMFLIKETVFCDMPCSPLQVHWHFRGTHCFHIQGLDLLLFDLEDGGGTFLLSISGLLWNTTEHYHMEDCVVSRMRLLTFS
jgi:hypothetical protein